MLRKGLEIGTRVTDHEEIFIILGEMVLRFNNKKVYKAVSEKNLRTKIFYMK